MGFALLLGSAGEGQTAFFDCKMDNNSSVKIIYESASNVSHYLSVVDKKGNPTDLVLPIFSIGQIIYKGETLKFYVNQVRTEDANLVGHFGDPHDSRLVSLVVSFFPRGKKNYIHPIRIFVPTPSGKTEKGFCKVEL